MLLIIIALVIALVPVYFVLAGFVELARHADLRRSIVDAFAAHAATLTASMHRRRRTAGA